MYKKTQTKVVAIYMCSACNHVLQIEYLENRPYCSCGVRMELVAASVVPFSQAEEILKRRAFSRERSLTSEPLFAGVGAMSITPD
jgi:hypothetical protein